MRLKDKICVVTGGSRGIGRAIVEAFSREGARVVFTYCTHHSEALTIARNLGIQHVYKLDVRQRTQVAELMSCLSRIYGRIDVLVNNAGINRPADFDAQTDEEWKDVLDVNLVGPFRVCQEALPLLSDGGTVINIGSLSGEYGGPRTPSYAASKGGLMALTHCLARFLGPRQIRVNCLSPGIVSNEFTASTMTPSVRALLDSLLLLKRPANSDEIADVAVFLASDESRYITAQTISVNGGAWVR